jgi:putative endonuclease
VVIVVGPPEPAPPTAETLDDRLRAALAGMSLKDAAAAVAAELGLPRKAVYARALELTRGHENPMKSGRTAHHGGLAAEDIAARLYEAEGARVLARRWRCPAGEIDLIVATPDTVVFVEVKARRSRDAAALALTPAQTARLAAAAETWLGEHQSAKTAPPPAASTSCSSTAPAGPSASRTPSASTPDRPACARPAPRP